MATDMLRSLDPRNLGRRLQEARKARGLTQQDAADHLDVARTTITAIEKGERRVQANELIRLAGYYGRSVGELLRRGEPVEAFAVQLRSTPAAKSLDGKDVQSGSLEFQRLCEDYLELERITDSPLPRKYPPEYGIDARPAEIDAEDIAVAERNRLGLGDGPLLNLREILEQDVGLRIFFIEFPSSIAGMFAYTDELGGCIAVNRKHPDELRRMSLSHDYGHFLTSRYRPAIDLAGRYQRVPEYERFCEGFARAFLMPATGLSRRFNDLRRSHEGLITNADLSRLAHLYFVSLSAMTLRLEELRLIRSGTWERMQQSGYRPKEAQALLHLTAHPATDQLLPSRYRYLAVAAFARGELSQGQLARFLRVDHLEARRIADEMANHAILSDAGTVDTLHLDLDATLPIGGG